MVLIFFTSSHARDGSGLVLLHRIFEKCCRTLPWRLAELKHSCILLGPCPKYTTGTEDENIPAERKIYPSCNILSSDLEHAL